MLDSFGIVEPVKGENDLRVAESVAQCLGFLLHSVTLYIISNLPVVDAHRKGVNFHRSFTVDEHLAKIMFNSQDAKYASEKMLRVVDGVESDQVSSQDTLQNRLAPSCWKG